MGSSDWAASANTVPTASSALIGSVAVEGSDSATGARAGGVGRGDGGWSLSPGLQADGREHNHERDHVNKPDRSHMLPTKWLPGRRSDGEPSPLDEVRCTRGADNATKSCASLAASGPGPHRSSHSGIANSSSTRPRPKALHRAACALYHKGVPTPGSRMKQLVEGRHIPRGPREGPRYDSDDAGRQDPSGDGD